MRVYIFGNGNISFDNFERYYKKPLQVLLKKEDVEFLICDFRGTDTLVMELLKNYTSKVTIYHIGEKPRYFPDKYKTNVGQWRIKRGFKSDEDRDAEAINDCSHFLAIDFNSDDSRKSGTKKNIELCFQLSKISLSDLRD